MTKKQILNEITEILKADGGERFVANIAGLRQPNRGLHAYCIRYNPTADTTYIYPWSMADNNYGWEFPLARIPKSTMEFLLYAVSLGSEK